MDGIWNMNVDVGGEADIQKQILILALDNIV